MGELRANPADAPPTRQATLIVVPPHAAPLSASNYLFAWSAKPVGLLVGTLVGAIRTRSSTRARARTVALLDGGEALEAVFADVRAVVESDLEIGEKIALAVGAATAAAYLAGDWRERDDVGDAA